MMFSRLKTIFFLLLSLCSVSAFAQELDPLPVSGDIKVGSFPNGINYYLIKNPATPGLADFALVQKGEQSGVDAREVLRDFHAFGSRSPYRYLASKGVGYKAKGFVDQGDDHTVYRFADVPVTDASVTDTTLMSIFMLCNRCPSSQAVVVSGDIDPSTLQGKMSVFSLMITKREPVAADPEYIWEAASGANVITTSLPSGQAAVVSVSFASPRPTRESMGTIQSVVTDMLFDELSFIVKERAAVAFRSAGIPYTGLDIRRQKASDGPGDESWTVSVVVDDNYVTPALETISAILANIDAAGVSADEFEDARIACLWDRHREAGRSVIPNSEYVDRCVSSFLYGSGLQSKAWERDYLLRKRLDTKVETKFFNSFAAALLDDEDNLTIRVDAPGFPPGEDGLYITWLSPWRKDQHQRAVVSHHNDTTLLAKAPKRSKLRLETFTEPVTGGSTWIFLNGVKAVYCKGTSPGMFDYSFVLRGGSASVRDLAHGEAAFFADELFLGSVAGMSPHNFSTMLKTNGIDMKCEVSPVSMKIFGKAPSAKLDLLLSCLVSIFNSTVPDDGAWEYYSECERLSLEVARSQESGIRAAVDSLLRPSFTLTPFKYISALTDEIPAKADGYFFKEFAKAGDGVLAISGDLDEETAQVSLCRYMNLFHKGRSIIPNAGASYELRSGWASKSERTSLASGESLHLELASTHTITPQRYYAAKVAARMLEARLDASLPDTGWWAEVAVSEDYFPVELSRITVTLRPCESEGLPMGVEPVDGAEVLSVVKGVLEDFFETDPTKKELKTLKSVLVKEGTFNKTNPSAIMDVVEDRHAFGKDMTSKYKESIESVTPVEVKEVISFFEGGSKAEYRILQ